MGLLFLPKVAQDGLQIGDDIIGQCIELHVESPRDLDDIVEARRLHMASFDLRQERVADASFTLKIAQRHAFDLARHLEQVTEPHD